METIVLGFLLRFLQFALESVLTILVGVVVAGIFRRMVGPANTRRLFGRGLPGLLRGWLAGMLLPVCALGVIPVARELRRAGVPGGTVLSFVLAAPLLNPISFLYGLTLAEPVVILSFAAASLLISTLAGWFWDYLMAGDANEAAEQQAIRADAEPLPAEGPRRLLAVAVTAARELTGRDWLFYIIGLTGSALLAALIPFGALQHSMKYTDPFSPLLMAALALPIYSAPLPGMMKIGLMFDHGNSIGAAFVLFALGIGTSLGTLAWLICEYGNRRLLPWLAGYLGLIVSFGYVSEPVLYDTRKADAGHTHAFDDYSCPFTKGTSLPEAWRLTQEKLDAAFGPLERPPVYALLVFVVSGYLIRRLDRDGRVERWLTARAPELDALSTRPWWNRSVPGPVLGGVILLGLIAFSVIGAYIYYPDRNRCFDEMQAVYAETFVAIKTKRADEAIRQLEHWDLLVRKLEVGEYLRAGRVSREQSQTAANLREMLEELRDHLLAGQADQASTLLPELQKIFHDLKTAFPREAEPSTSITMATAAVSEPGSSPTKPSAPPRRPLTRLLVQDHAACTLRWGDIRIAADGSLSLDPLEVIPGFPMLDQDKQNLVQMEAIGERILCGVRDKEDGEFGSGWVMLTSGVRYVDHGDHGHWIFRRKPRVLDHRIDANQGNPAHLYVYQQRFYLANDLKKGYSEFVPERWSLTSEVRGEPRFIPGGGNHITLAVAGEPPQVGYGTWIDGGGPNAGRVDVSRLPADTTPPSIAYSFKLSSGVIHGATTAAGKVFFAPNQGIDWVSADLTVSQSAKTIKIQHIDLGKSGEKPRRTGAFTVHANHVFCVTGSGPDAQLVFFDARENHPQPTFLSLAAAEGLKPVPPIIVTPPNQSPLALIFLDRDGSTEAMDTLQIVALDPNRDGNFTDARIDATLAVGKSAVSGHYGHHDAAADANGEFAFITNPGSATISALDLKRKVIVAEFTVPGMPTHLIAAGGRETDD